MGEEQTDDYRRPRT